MSEVLQSAPLERTAPPEGPPPPPPPGPISQAVAIGFRAVYLAMALLADISIIAEDVRFTDGNVRIGVAAGDHAVMLWPLLCGLAKAKYYLLTADFIDGREAERIGLVSKAVPRERLMEEAMAVAAKLAAGPVEAVRWTKKALNNWLRNAGPLFDASLALEMMWMFGRDMAEIVSHPGGNAGDLGLRMLGKGAADVAPSMFGDA